MAVFGVQLAFSMIMATFISKLGIKFSLATILLCKTGLVRYLHPTDDELRELGGISKESGKGKGRGKNSDLKNPNSFHVPKDIDIRLDSVKVTDIEVMNLRFFPEYHWVVDYAFYAAIVYIATEIYCFVFKSGNTEMNLSVFWLLVALFLTLKVLCAITSIYFQSDEVMGERSLCLMMAFVYLLIAMVMLIIREETLEVGLDSAYQSFHDSASEFLEIQGLPTAGPASKLFIWFIIVVICAFVGGLFTFSGIRMSKMFWDSLRYCEGRPIVKFFLYLTYAFPLFLCTLWIKPISRDLCTKPFIASSVSLMTDATFDSLRLFLVLLFIFLRFVLMPYFLQSFLNVAQNRLIDQRNEAGRILNTEIQKNVASIYYYLCICALQYITPVIVLLQCALLYKTLGGGSWLGTWGESIEDEQIVQMQTAETTTTTRPINSSPETEAIKSLASLKMVFNATVFKGIFGLATWWCLFLITFSSLVGSFYMSYNRT